MNRTRKSLLASLLVALTASLGYALAAVPNVELMTITVFVSGYLLGVRLGMVVGAASMALHSLFNPLGAALPPLMAVQVLSFAVIGLSGALCAPFLQGIKKRMPRLIIGGIMGFVLTFFYDVLTSVAAYFVSMDMQSTTGLWHFVAGGILFMGMHLVWNASLFFVALAPVLKVLHPYRDELSANL